MKKNLLLALLLVIVCFASAQSLSRVIFSNGSVLSSFSFITDQQVIIKISPTGNIIEWGNDAGQWRFYPEPWKLQPYLGRVEYYGSQYDSAYRSKVKSIGTCPVTYYSSFDKADLTGKVKSIGNLVLDYYADFENESVKGKLKTAGQTTFTFYTSFENEAYRGNLKSVGANTITYHSTFDDKLIRGKIKSIGQFTYAWYTSFESNRFHGGLKNGLRAQRIDGVEYVIW